MLKKMTAVFLITALSCLSLIACSPKEDAGSSSLPESSTNISSSSSEVSSGTSSESTDSSAASSGGESSGVAASSEAAPSSTPPSGANASGTTGKKYTETDESFTFKDGVYKRIYGNRAMFIVTKDGSSMETKELNKLAEETAGTYYKDKYYCTVVFVKPDKDDGTFDITNKKSDERIATVISLHKPDSSKMTINLKERPLQEYIDKQIAKAKVNKKA